MENLLACLAKACTHPWLLCRTCPPAVPFPGAQLPVIAVARTQLWSGSRGSPVLSDCQCRGLAVWPAPTSFPSPGLPTWALHHLTSSEARCGWCSQNLGEKEHARITFIPVHCYDRPTLLFVIVNLLLSLIYEINVIVSVYLEDRAQSLSGSGLCSSIGSWNGSSVGRRDYTM